jgi:hypothetical protein
MPKRKLTLKKLTLQNLNTTEKANVKGGTAQTVCVITCIAGPGPTGCATGDTARYPGGMCL